MADLSSAAQAVLDAYGNELLRPGPLISGRHPLAAALQAVADQVVPSNPCGNDCCITQCEEIRAQLLAIAAELEDVNG
jgi:hypothetical protein